MKKKIISGIVITSLMLLNSCSLFQKGPYEPYKSGHGYSLTEDGYSVPVTNQSGGTCWANACSAAMRYNLQVTCGTDTDIDITGLTLLTYSGDPEDGIEGLYCNNIPWAGGTQVIVSGTVANYGINGYVLTGSDDLTSADREVLQDRIRTYGALNTIIVTDPHMLETIRDNATCNIPDATFENTNHMVTIVGWDDDYPADAFDPPASSNGAWRIQDSQGVYFGDEGFYWLSYDTPIFGITDFQLSDRYTEVLSYEVVVQAEAVTEGGTSTANVFDHEGTIGAIGTYTTGPDQTLTVEIYDGSFGELLYSEEQTFEYVGYHTIELDEPLDVTSYTVVIHYPEGAPVEGASNESDVSESGGFFSGAYGGCYATIEEGQSYICIDGEWVDMSTEGIEDWIDIRCDTLATIPGKTEEALVAVTAVPNNACIKVLYVA